MLPWALCWTPICAIFSVCKAANLRVKRSQSSTVTLSDCVGCPAPWPQARQCANTSTSIDDRGTNVECLAVSYLSTREKGFEASTLNDEWQGHSGPVRKQTWEERALWKVLKHNVWTQVEIHLRTKYRRKQGTTTTTTTTIIDQI